MLSQCITLAVLGCAFASPVAQYQQQDEGIPPHLLRQYIGGGQAQAQHIPRPAPQPTPAPARLPYNVQEEQYQPRAQYQPQPQPQPQQQYRPQQQREPEEYEPSPNYQFGFDVSDDKFTNYQNRQEQKDGDQIKGSYSVVDSDGFIRTVTYTADPKEGFRAEVSRKPTDIVVKYPTPKPPGLQPQGPQQQQVAYQPAQLQQQQQHQQQQQQQRPQQANPQYYRYE